MDSCFNVNKNYEKNYYKNKNNFLLYKINEQSPKVSRRSIYLYQFPFSAKANQRQEKQKQAFGFTSATSTTGFQVEPHVAIVVSLLYVGIVIVLHMIGKYRKDTVTA